MTKPNNYKNRFAKFAIAWLLSIVIASGLSAQEKSPAIDGVFDEWTTENQIATDPRGDATGAFDLTTVSANTAGTVVSLQFDIGQVINLQNGEESDGTLQLKIAANDKKIEIDFRRRTATNPAGEPIGWQAIGFQCLPTYASDKYEIQVDLSRLEVGVGDEVSLQFAGSDSLQQPVRITLADAKNQSRDPINWSKPLGAIRVASQNTLHNGLASPDRQEQFKRLFTAANADVYCFQEEWELPEFIQGLPKTVPRTDPVNYLWNGDCAIATTNKLVGLPLQTDKALAGLVTRSDGKSVVVVSVHFECCGFAGSRADDLRIQQARQLVGGICRMREGAFGEVARTAPVILIGDYNLVGSRKTLDVINAAGFQDKICRGPDGSASTWRGLKPDSSFWPGRLDLVATSGFQSVHGRVFDCSRLSPAELKQLGVEATDSDASDHLMLVVDCEIGQ